MKNFKIAALTAGMLFGGVSLVYAQQGGAFQEMLNQIEEAMVSPSSVRVPEIAVPATDSVVAPEKLPAVWKIGSINSLNFSQVSLTNWSAGGQGSIALNAFTDWSAKVSKGRHVWENRLQAGYGFVKSYGDPYKKSDDRLIFDSKWGCQAYEKLFFSASFNFTSQMTTGYEYPKTGDPKKISSFMSPGYFALGVGMDYKPYNFFSINVSPLTSKLVVVTDTLLRTRYGNRADEAVRVELGAQIKLDFKKEVFKNVVIASDLTLFSDYLGVPSNIKVFWNILVDMKVNKFLSANFRVNMIYDDEIMITDSNGNVGPRLQIKEVLGVGLTYSFGQK